MDTSARPAKTPKIAPIGTRAVAQGAEAPVGEPPQLMLTRFMMP